MDGDFNLAVQHDLPPLDAAIADAVAIDYATRKLHVEPRNLSHPLVLTFLHRCTKRGITLSPVPTEIDVIQGMRDSGFRLKAAAEASGPESETGNLDLALDILKQSESYDANDIHVRRMGNYTLVELRIKRSLRTLKRLNKEEGKALDRAFFTGLATSKSGSYMPLQYQDAEISGPAMDEIGLSTVRIVRGYCAPYANDGGIMVLRLQRNGKKRLDRKIVRTQPLPYPRVPEEKLDLLSRGYDQRQVDDLLYLAEGTSGVVLFTGPTGSGKTTTMADLLRHTAIIAPDLRQITLERPVEIPMPWAVQIPIIGDFANPEQEGAAFAKMLKNILRMDPDIIGVNEIRIAEVARLIFEAGMTGHKAYSSLHTNCPYQFAERIELMDRDKLPRASFCDHKLIRGIVNQRLVPVLCNHCAKPLSAASSDYFTSRQRRVIHSYGDLSKVRIRGEGCPRCDYDGATRMTAVAEVIVTDEHLMHDLINRGSTVARRNYRSRPNADPSVLARAVKLGLAGKVDFRDVNKYVDTLEPRESVNA